MSPSISNNLSVNLSRLFGQGRGLERTDGRMGRRVQAIAPHSGTTASLIYKLCIYLVLFFRYSKLFFKSHKLFLSHVYLAPPVGVIPMKFNKDLWQQKTTECQSP